MTLGKAIDIALEYLEEFRNYVHEFPEELEDAIAALENENEHLHSS